MPRNYQAPNAEELRLWGDAPPGQWMPEIYLGDKAPILIRSPEGKRESRLARFGLVPWWARKEHSTPSMQTMAWSQARSLPFVGPFKKRQWCVVPAWTFYLPATQCGDVPERWGVQRRDAQGIGMAGIWERWREPGSRREIITFAIVVSANGGPALSTDGSATAGEVPVLVAAEDYDLWLGATDAEATQLVRQAAPWTEMVASPAPVDGSTPYGTNGRRQRWF